MGICAGTSNSTYLDHFKSLLSKIEYNYDGTYCHGNVQHISKHIFNIQVCSQTWNFQFSNRVVYDIFKLNIMSLNDQLSKIGFLNGPLCDDQ